MTDTLFERLSAALPGLPLLAAEPLAKHTSFRIGGPVEVLAAPRNEEELAALLRFCAAEGIWPRVLGGGTNVLAPDGGLPGLVISTRGLDTLELVNPRRDGTLPSGSPQANDRSQGDPTPFRSENGEFACGKLRSYRTPDGNVPPLQNDGLIVAGAGVPLARLALFAQQQGLTGLEFAHGIPGTVGGGMVMNAGAYGGELVQVAVSARFLTRDGTLKTYEGPEMGLSYRHSAFMEEPGVVISAAFRLTPGDPEAILARMRELMERRRASQPLDLPSAGSTFKRPVGGYAAALIQNAGLKGLRVGGAAVSEKHAGFVVNLGGATGADVLTLMSQVRARVKESSGIELEPEVRIW